MLGEREVQILAREIRKEDRLFKDLLFVSNFASVYHYSGEWDKLNIEGTFVMYSRACHPFVGIYVFNRKSLKDFCLHLTKETSFGVKKNFMTINKGGMDGTHGLWFHNDSHPQEVLKRLEEFL
ncbi:Dcp1-like decapping protein [Encephalitozoon romaleae SJ-2008]|uniref:Dcp1-like decapping protein n=1 Tax=Encephalitozoon romaleae (strain SJ-2008) TaxID=1178016 RepID=I6ZWC3_ENCRO|nr:Dcp1-like decapping protein [Encephalitozoon romaleae SJ-2008]AFN84066.1 Dcp1-like decapping protein [Encephalitozoon romaleae SJ-2008]